MILHGNAKKKSQTKVKTDLMNRLQRNKQTKKLKLSKNSSQRKKATNMLYEDEDRRFFNNHFFLNVT